MSTNDERNVDPIQEMTRIVQSFFDLRLWGFKESYRSANTRNLIYDSPFCRFKLVWEGWDFGGGNNISIYYGRLHAANEGTTLIWDGEKCYCWHDFDLALHFLDGKTPMDAAKLHFSHPITDPFYEVEFRQKFRRRQPEWLAQMHATIWQQYGKRFFELFDLRLPDLWRQYQKFLKEVYDIEGRIPEIEPSLDKVC
jgi:hypothetical protein